MLGTERKTVVVLPRVSYFLHGKHFREVRYLKTAHCGKLGIGTHMKEAEEEEWTEEAATCIKCKRHKQGTREANSTQCDRPP